MLKFASPAATRTTWAAEDKKLELQMGGSEIAIVGGGIAGLTAALRIGAAGGRPILFEAAPEVGGRAQTRVIDGFCLNQGPHALYAGGAFHATLREFKIPFGGGGPDLPNGLALWGRVPYPLPIRRSNRYVEPLGESAAEALAAFFEQAAADDDLGRGVALRDAIGSLPVQARTVVEAFVRLSTYVHAPGELDAKSALDQLRLSFAGTIYVDGGWRVLVERMLGAATAAGAVIRSSERVMRVRIREDACWIDLRGGQTERFAAVILTVSPKRAAAVLEDSAQLKTMAANARPVRLMSLDLAVATLPRTDANFALGMDAPTYLSVHSAVSKLAPAGGALVHLARYLAPDEQSSPDHFEGLRQIADTLHPGWREHLLHEQRLSAATVAHDFPRWTDGGRRAAYFLDDAPGVFLAGDWVGEKGMLADAAVASAQDAAAAAMERVQNRSTCHVPGQLPIATTGTLSD
ncbi:phytoene desaturase family protein [Bosea vestrisii]|uniref:Phytoene desaturase family protein n=1 Tax=Bosea vestrisii TaxID=151416 RepID=A0ABW0HJD3_9HYPH